MSTLDWIIIFGYLLTCMGVVGLAVYLFELCYQRWFKEEEDDE